MQGALAEAIAAFQRGDLVTARALAEEELKASHSPQFQHLLGLIFCRQGDPQTGAKWLMEALGAEPSNDAYRVMAIRALLDAGRPSEAMAEARRPGGSTGADMALWHARAEAAEAIGDSASATEAWQVLCSVRANDAQVWRNLARNLLRLRRFDDSERGYLRAMDLAPGDAAIILELGSLYERSNQFAKLDTLLDRSLRSGITREQLPELWAHRLLRQSQPTDAHTLLRQSTDRGDPVRWWRVRSRVADAAGFPAEAFEAASAMNRATPDFDNLRSRGAAYRREIREIAAAVTPEWAAAIPRLEDRSDRRLAFLVGFPRSGTTLLDTFLMGHPDIAVIEEQGLLVSSAEALGPISGLPRCSPDQLRGALRLYDRRLADEIGHGFSGVTVDKAPLNMLLAPLMHALFGDPPIIFAQRHPCDAVLSGFMQSFVANIGMASFLDIADAADFYDAAMTLWTACRNALPLRVHTVVYEDVLDDPEGALRPAVDFLGLDWDGCLLDHQSTASKRELILNPSFDQVIKPLSKEPAGRWRRYEIQLETVLPVLLPWAERLGYPV